MEIPKMKIFIYILTFAAYSWSGYGSDVLGNLRDAVLSAENVFGDVLEKVTDVFKALKQVKHDIDVTVNEECSWSCPGGVKAKLNKYYKRMSNGCGPVGLEVNIDGTPFSDMTKCCNEHDYCYGTCNKQKDKCDIDFKRCLYKVCNDLKNPGSAILTACKTAAKVLETGSWTFGCKFYQDAQAAGCYCPIPRNKYNEL